MDFLCMDSKSNNNKKELAFASISSALHHKGILTRDMLRTIMGFDTTTETETRTNSGRMHAMGLNTGTTKGIILIVLAKGIC